MFCSGVLSVLPEGILPSWFQNNEIRKFVGHRIQGHKCLIFFMNAVIFFNDVRSSLAAPGALSFRNNRIRHTNGVGRFNTILSYR